MTAMITTTIAVVVDDAGIPIGNVILDISYSILTVGTIPGMAAIRTCPLDDSDSMHNNLHVASYVNDMFDE